MPSTDALPLPVLLSRVLCHLTATVEKDAGVGPDVPSLAVWANVLRPVADAGHAGMDERALPEAARISRRLATAAVTGAARRGWLTAGPGRAGAKSRHLQLSDIGQAAAALWPARLAALDTGRHRSPLRDALEPLVGRLPFEMPHYPASYGAADPSAVGGPFVKPGSATVGAPAHGTDWTPVPRAEGATVSGLPLTALLSQALMAFTIDYESRFPWPLASTATVLCHLSAEPRPLAGVPGDHGITGTGKSLLERHLIATVSTDPADRGRKLVALTERGVAVLHHHPGRLDTVEAEWRERFGETAVAELRHALGLTAKHAGGQPDHVIAPLHNG